jgi:hypothetical protein
MATVCSGPVWDAHAQFGTTYDLGHLHPFFLEHRIDAIPAKPGRPGRTALDMRIYITFSHHCFTQSLQSAGSYQSDETYVGNGEARCFSADRWQLSHLLPSIARELPAKRLYHTRHHNYLTVEMAAGPGPVNGDYIIYFRAQRSRAVDVDIFIESAYIRLDKPHLQKSTWKMGFNAILMNVLQGRRPHPPP